MKIEEQASIPLAGGIIQYGYQCGMIWGASLAAGAQANKVFGTGPKAEAAAILAAQGVVETFHTLNKEINCSEIVGMGKKSPGFKIILRFILKGGPIGCYRMAAKFAHAAYDKINKVLSEKNIEAPSPPLSCSAILAKKLGLSDKQTVMAAGLAGGIGLCGGACGVLGTAIWNIGLTRNVEDQPKFNIKDPEVLETIDQFMKITDSKFECSEIVGRKFENVADHAAYMRDGGCSKILEVLTGK